MDRKRRSFLGGVLPLLAGVTALAAPQQPQDPMRPPERPALRDITPPPPKPKPRERLKHDRKQVREQAEQLFELAGEIHDEVMTTDSVEVLPLKLLKKLEEMEKLTKRMRSLLRG